MRNWSTEIISGGTPSNVLAELQNAQLPALKTLVFRRRGYGFDGSLDDVMALARKIFSSAHPSGLMNSEEQDDIARRVLKVISRRSLTCWNSCENLERTTAQRRCWSKDRIAHLRNTRSPPPLFDAEMVKS